MSKENKSLEKYTKIFATLVGFATGVLLNISPIAGENLISTKGQLTCKLGSDQQILIVKDPKPEQKEMLEVVCMMLQEVPELSEVAITVGYDKSGGSYDSSSKSINVDLENMTEKGKNIIIDNPVAVDIIRKRVGITQEALEKHPELIMYFLILHEFSHAQIDRILYYDAEYYKEKYPELHTNNQNIYDALAIIEDARRPIPNLDSATIKRNGSYVSERLMLNMIRYYRYGFHEKLADRNAARWLGKYLEISHPEYLSPEYKNQQIINTRYSSVQGVREAVGRFLTKDPAWFIEN